MAALIQMLKEDRSLSASVAAYTIIIFIVSATGYLDKILRLIPNGIAAGMMTGILFQFGLDLFKATDTMTFIVFSMLACLSDNKTLYCRHF